MSKNIEDVIKDLTKIVKDMKNDDTDLFRQLFLVNKDLLLIKKDTDNLKRDMKSISNKIDLVLEILNSLTIMVLDEEDVDEDDEESPYGVYDSDDSWVPNEDQDYEDDEWSNSEDES